MTEVHFKNMAAKKINHTHTWIRYRVVGASKNVIYRCAHKDCYAQKDRRELMGKSCTCFMCQEVFVLNHKDLLLAKPRCPKCSKRKDNVVRQSAVDIMDLVLGNSDITEEVPSTVIEPGME